MSVHVVLSQSPSLHSLGSPDFLEQIDPDSSTAMQRRRLGLLLGTVIAIARQACDHERTPQSLYFVVLHSRTMRVQKRPYTEFCRPSSWALAFADQEKEKIHTRL